MTVQHILTTDDGYTREANDAELEQAIFDMLTERHTEAVRIVTPSGVAYRVTFD